MCLRTTARRTYNPQTSTMSRSRRGGVARRRGPRDEAGSSRVPSARYGNDPHHEDTAVTTGRYLFTSESVTMGHPDKVADQISDGVLDAILEQDSQARVACEALVATGLALVAGEFTTSA